MALKKYKEFYPPFGRAKNYCMNIDESIYEDFISEFDQLYVLASLEGYVFDSKFQHLTFSLAFFNGEDKRFIFDFHLGGKEEKITVQRVEIYKYNPLAEESYVLYNGHCLTDLIESFREFKKVFANID